MDLEKKQNNAYRGEGYVTDGEEQIRVVYEPSAATTGTELNYEMLPRVYKDLFIARCHNVEKMLGIENMQWKKGAQRSQKEHDLLLEYDRCKAIQDKIRTKVNDKIKNGVPSWGLIDPNNPSENNDPPLGNGKETTWQDTQVSYYYVLKECFRLWWNRLG